MECVFDNQKLQAVRVGTCEVLPGYSWLGFTQDWLFFHAMLLLWQLDE